MYSEVIMSYRYPSRAQQGFTLIEIAIVLVIIGLLLGGVLKGQEMIANARVKNAINDLNGVATAYQSYVDRYRRLPGDDGNLGELQARGGNWSNISTVGDNNGRIDIAQAAVFVPATEASAFWQHLRAAGFLNGNPADTGAAALPRNAFNGLLGVGNGVTMANGQTPTSLCLSQVPGKSARQIDVQLDDGVAGQGQILATQTTGGDSAPAAAAAAYSDDEEYTVCRTL